ncbi:AAA family ATPase [Thiorhodococcus mannitoliphagus]|uniref:AAA family ATPase n=1 Tax=Thiorhodococcus mannitoliphagus TaxID=329406 RepID=A0A6P1E2Z9_9GAMM|nr:AAA family ATPase [Thiorhodococcus mannitoliphagus]NEX22862.1 AAA family ATPase [Thiorhodococcus mannitoliphagus]
MYESFFGLNEKPFSLLPDPSFLYFSKIHREALTLVEYGLYSQSGFTVLTGEIGSGKTTLMRYLLDKLDDDLTVGLISHTHQSIGQIMDWVCVAFELDAPAGDKIRQHEALVGFLLQQYKEGKKTLLIIDEAQNLGLDKLEEIRLLSNINADKDLVLQLLLLGQPQLRDQLRSPDLEQFVQRVSASYHLGRLNAEETFYYIRHRLKIAGGHRAIFTPDACHAVFHYSNGIPRIINLICETALVFSYGAGHSQITGEAIDQFIKSDASNLLISLNQSERLEPDSDIAAKLEAAAKQLDEKADIPAPETRIETPPTPSRDSGIESAGSASALDPPSASATLVAEANEPQQEARPTAGEPNSPEIEKEADSDEQLPPAALIKPSRVPSRRLRELIAVAAGVALGLGLSSWYLHERGSDQTTIVEPTSSTEQPSPSSTEDASEPPRQTQTRKTDSAPLETADSAQTQEEEDIRSIAVAPLQPSDPRQVPDDSLGIETPDSSPSAAIRLEPSAQSQEEIPSAAQTRIAPIAAADQDTAPSAPDPEQPPLAATPTTTSIDAAAVDPQEPKITDEGQATQEIRASALNTLETALASLPCRINREESGALTLDFSESIRFRDGSTALDSTAMDALRQLSEILKGYDGIRLRVLSHTDSRGSRSANKALSERRAQRVADFIKEQGLAEASISYEGKGEEDLKIDPAEEVAQGPWINRRIEIELTESP